MKNITDKAGTLNSVYPPTEYLTFGVWIYLVPQYKIEDCLLLGYAGGTVAGLIRLIYGGIPIDAVDIEDCENYYNVNLYRADAREFIKTVRRYDCVVVDLFEDGSYTPCDFIFSKEFAGDLKKVARYIIIHADKDSDMSAYDDIKLVKMLSLNDSRFYYYRTEEIHILPIQ
jgi:hypothetical protein